MGRIRVLPDRVANQIAAGEVVERPASVVKELFENSLDAGAKRIHIEIEKGGRKLIRVSDDGCGMGRDDAMLAFERHATSKLREVGDLLAIPTLGFRGEALPSIASVSRLTLETSSGDEEIGSRVEIAGGRMLNVEDQALPPGTTVTVKDLFYNVPARRKFLRTDKTELSHVAALATHYSLAHLDKTIQLSNESGPLLQVTPVESLRERVYQIFGSDALDQLVELETVSRELEVVASPLPPTRAVEEALEGGRATERQVFSARGFVSKPHVEKLSRNSIFLFVNNRLIRDRVLLKSISSAYHNILPPGSFPFTLLFLDMPFDEVDVNVHPAKTEVRFRHQSYVYDFVRDAIRDRLIRSKPVSTMPMPASPGQPATKLPFSEGSSRIEREDDHPSEVAPELRLKPQAPPTAHFDFSSAPAYDFPPSDHGEPEAAPAPEPPPKMPPASAPTFPLDSAPHSRARLVDDPTGETLADVGSLRALGQIKDSFIIAAGYDGLWIIDQHVAHERILFEQVLRNRQRGAPESQRLLMPIIVTLTPEQQIAFDQINEEIDANGFEIEPFGHRTVAVKAAPAGLSPSEIETLLHEILETPDRELRELSLDDLQKQVAATVACHAAIKINTPLDPPKMRWLLEALGKTECPMACPHGRPIALKYELKDILKAFHRI
ncbi:MAG: DNA mismatch repair endonuclease MutL [Acidobacteria bacterium]|nr:DNA mismatch repair endonuclease MutL [Acidobacteriota bacterium]